MRSVIDRLSQIEPNVLLAVDGYRYGEREVDRGAEVAAIRVRSPSLAATVILPYLRTDAVRRRRRVTWAELLAAERRPALRAGRLRPPAVRPLLVGHDRAAEADRPRARRDPARASEDRMALHHDLGPADRFFWFSTTGWMMWNYLVSGLAVEATSSVDGSPAHPDLGSLWQMAAEEGVTYFGASAPYLMACRKAGLRPAEIADLSRLRGDRLHRRAAARRGVPVRLRGDQPIGPSPVGLRRHRCVHRLRRRLAARAGVGRRDQLPPSRLCGRGVRSRWAARSSASRGSSSSPGRCRRCPSASGTTPTARAIARRTSTTCRASGATATGSRSPSAVPASSAGRSDATLNRGGVRIGTAEFYARRRGPARDRRLARRPSRRRRPAAPVRRPARRGRSSTDELRDAHRRRAATPSPRATCRTRSSPCPRSRARCRARSSRCR